MEKEFCKIQFARISPEATGHWCSVENNFLAKFVVKHLQWSSSF